MIDLETPQDGYSDEDIASIIETIASMDVIKELAKYRLYNST